VVANKAAARSLVSSSSSRDRSLDRAANKAASRSKAPLRNKEPLASAGGFYLLDRSPIESDAFLPAEIRDVKLKTYSTSPHTFVVPSVFCKFLLREESKPVKYPNPFLLARNLVSANRGETRSGFRLLNNQGSTRR
jgi:hypothetical protein